MTKRETANVVSMVRLSWPHSTLGDSPTEIHATWHDELRDLTSTAVELAVQRLRRSGREHAPPIGVIVQTARLLAAGDPIGFDDMQRLLDRHSRCLPYRPQGQHPGDTIVALERLAAAGVPEIALRFVQQEGVFAVRFMPDPASYALDANQLADRRDKARAYRDRTIPDWRSDPSPGLALRRAQAALNVPSGDRGLRHLDPASGLRALTAHEDGPVATADQVAEYAAQARKLIAHARLRSQQEEKAA